MDSTLKQLRIAIDKIKVGINNKKLTLTESERRNFSNIKASVRNIIDDGYVGGESGVSETHIERSLNWCNERINRMY